MIENLTAFVAIATLLIMGALAMRRNGRASKPRLTEDEVAIRDAIREEFAGDIASASIARTGDDVIMTMRLRGQSPEIVTANLTTLGRKRREEGVSPVSPSIIVRSLNFPSDGDDEMSPDALDLLMSIEKKMGIPYDIDPGQETWPRTAGQVHSRLMQSLADPRFVNPPQMSSDELWGRLTDLVRHHLREPQLVIDHDFDLVAAVERMSSQ